MKIKQIFFFNNGTTAVFDEKGEQMPKLQKPWMKVYRNFLEEHGVDPADIKDIEIIMPNTKIAGYTDNSWHIKDKKLQ